MDRVPISGSRELQIKKKKRSPNAPNYEVKNTQISSAPPKTSFDTKVNLLAISTHEQHAAARLQCPRRFSDYLTNLLKCG